MYSAVTFVGTGSTVEYVFFDCLISLIRPFSVTCANWDKGWLRTGAGSMSKALEAAADEEHDSLYLISLLCEVAEA